MPTGVRSRAAEPAGGLPARVALIGLMGSGKSSVGRRLARLLGYEFVDADAELARAAGCSVARIFAERGEAEFRRREAALLAGLSRRRRIVVAAGGGAVLRAACRRLLGGRFVTFHLEVGVAEAWRRLGTARGRPLLAAPSRRSSGRGAPDPGSPLRRLGKIAAARKRLYASVGIPIRTTGFTPGELALRLARRLGGGAAPGRTGRATGRGAGS
jgi:shikimate kinase